MNNAAKQLSPPRRRLSVAVFVIVVLVGVATLLLGALGIIGYRMNREQEMQRLRDNTAKDTDELALGLALPVWNFDRAQIDKVVESFMKDEDVYGVVVKIWDVHGSVHGRVRGDRWQIVVADGDIPAAGLFVEDRAISSPDEILGTVRLLTTPKFVEARLERTLVTIVATIVSIGLILVVSLYGLLWWVVLRPLKQVEKYAVAVSAGNRDAARISERPFLGEMENLRGSMATMVDELDNRYAQLQQAEGALRESEGLMKSMIENLPFEFWAKDLEGRYILQNPASMKKWGNQLGKRLNETGIHPDVQKRWDSANLRAMAGEVARNEWNWHDSKGEIHIFSEVVAPIYEGKKIRGLLGAALDITEQYRANKARLDSEERFQLVARGTNDGIWDWDLQTKTVYRSSRLKELLGFADNELDGSIDIFSTLLHPDDKARVTKLIDEHLAKRAVYDAEFRMRIKRGEYRWFHARGQAVWNEAGIPTRIAGSITDIDDRKQAEEKLLRYQQQLQSLASRLLLVEESERRNFSRLLHDHIGQNLTFAKIRLGGALRNKLDAPSVVEAIQEVLGVIEQMSAETRSLTYDLSPPLLYEIGLDAALEWLGEQFQKRYGLQCNLESPDETETLETDVRVVLFQSARELLFNVVKHAKAKSAMIKTSRMNGSMCLTISDDGVGFNPASVGTGSVGFGLFNVRERIKYMRGNFEVDSEPGRGCRVFITMPLSKIHG